MAPFSPLPVGWTPRSPRLPLRPSELSRPFPHIFGQTVPRRKQTSTEIICGRESKGWMVGLAVTCLLVVTWLATLPGAPISAETARMMSSDMFGEYGHLLDDLASPWPLWQEPKPMVGYGRKLFDRAEPAEAPSAPPSVGAPSAPLPSVSAPAQPSGRTITFGTPSAPGSMPSQMSFPTPSLAPLPPSPSRAEETLAARYTITPVARAAAAEAPSSSAMTSFSAPPQAKEPSAAYPEQSGDDDGQSMRRRTVAKRDHRRSRIRSKGAGI